MSQAQIKAAIFWKRVQFVARVNVRRAVEMLRAVGADIHKALRYVAAMRQGAMA